MSGCVPPAGDTALVLLAAGRGARFGGDKLTHAYRGRPLWEWAADAAEATGLTQLYIVLGPHSAIVPREGWRIVPNPNAGDGMGTSIAAGVAAASSHDRILVALADMPHVAPKHLRLLAAETGTVFTRQQDGSPGSPAGFGPECYAALRTLDGDRGARSLDLPNVKVTAPHDPAMLFDVDRKTDLDR